MAAIGAKLAIAGPNEDITEIPEIRHLKNAVLYDDRQYEDLGGWSGGVIAAVRLEGVVGLEAGPSAADTLVHEFAHQINALGISADEWSRWRTIYATSRAQGLWDGSYAGRNHVEFFAELTQCYFEVSVPGKRREWAQRTPCVRPCRCRFHREGIRAQMPP